MAGALADSSEQTRSHLVHFVKNMNTSFMGLSKSRFHNLFSDAFDLNVHLQRHNAFVGPCDFKVHVAR